MTLRWAIGGILLAALAPVGMTACGGAEEKTAATATATPTATPTQTSRPTATDGPARLKVGHSRLGSIVVDARGRTLYLFTQDTPGAVLCTSDTLNCTTNWPPLMTTGGPRGQAGVKPNLIGSFEREKPAGTQVTYNRHPLYHYVEDKKPGDLKGQGMFDYWYVVAPGGRPIKKK